MTMRTTLKILVSIILFLSISFFSMADQPPDPGGDPTGEPVGGSPIGSGLVISILFGVAYGSKKMIQFRKEK
jgi:hypothetical protein